MKRSGIVRALVDLLLRHRRLAGFARGLGDERERHHRGAREVVAGLLVGDVDQLPEAPLRREHRQRRLHVDAVVARAHGQRVRFGGRQAGLEAAVDEQAPHLLVGDRADEFLDVDAAVAQRATLSVGLGDLGGERNDAFEARLDLVLTDRAHGTRFWMLAEAAGTATLGRVDELMFSSPIELVRCLFAVARGFCTASWPSLAGRIHDLRPED